MVKKNIKPAIILTALSVALSLSFTFFVIALSKLFGKNDKAPEYNEDEV